MKKIFSLICAAMAVLLLFSGRLSSNEKKSMAETSTIEHKTYLYSYPPVPQPAKSHTSVSLYWDSRIKFNYQAIKVCDVYGNEITDANLILSSVLKGNMKMWKKCQGSNIIWFLS